MNDFNLSLLLLVLGILGQAVACGMASECVLRRSLSKGQRGLWLAVAGASLLLALQHGYALELALKTGLYDLRQAWLGSIAGLLYGVASWGFSARS